MHVEPAGSCWSASLHRGVDNFLGLKGGGVANKVKTEELQFGSMGRVLEGEAKNFDWCKRAN